MSENTNQISETQISKILALFKCRRSPSSPFCSEIVDFEMPILAPSNAVITLFAHKGRVDDGGYLLDGCYTQKEMPPNVSDLSHVCQDNEVLESFLMNFETPIYSQDGAYCIDFSDEKYLFEAISNLTKFITTVSLLWDLDTNKPIQL